MGTISCYLAIFNFIYTTGRHLNQKCVMIFLVERNLGKLYANFLSGTSTVIEKVVLLSYFSFLARATIRIRLNTLYVHYMFTICLLYVHYMFTICSLYVHYIFTICSLYAHYMFTVLRRWYFCRILHFLLKQLLEIVLIHYMFTICSLYVHYIEKVVLLSYFSFLARATIGIPLNM